LIIVFLVHTIGFTSIASFSTVVEDLDMVAQFPDWVYYVLRSVFYVLLVVYWIIIVGIAGPLFVVANELLGFRVRDFFKVSFQHSEKMEGDYGGSEPGGDA